jgi:hypothetical protein
MNTPITDAVVASQATRSSDRSGAPDTRLRGRRLILARVVWVVLVTLLVALFLAMLPAYYTLLQTVCTGVTCAIWQPTPDSAQTMQSWASLLAPMPLSPSRSRSPQRSSASPLVP